MTTDTDNRYIETTFRANADAKCEECGLLQHQHGFGMGNRDPKIGECPRRLKCKSCPRPAMQFWSGGGFSDDQDGQCAYCCMLERMGDLRSAVRDLLTAHEHVEQADNGDAETVLYNHFCDTPNKEISPIPMSLDEWDHELLAWIERFTEHRDREAK